MSRSEERVESGPLMEMMHMIAHRRQMPDAKNQNLELDSLSAPRNVGEEAVRHADFELALREAANLASGGGDGDDRSSSGRRHRHSAATNGKRLHRIRLGPTLTTSLSFKGTRNVAPSPEKLMADDSTGRFAYISLDGRLINAELATSATSIGGTLGHEEAQAWEDFVPMQRILIVAVSAAAAAAAKHRNREEIGRLLKTVEKRVLRNGHHRILSAMASLCNIILSSLHTFFWTLVTTMGVTSLWSLLSWSGMLTGRLKLLPSMWSQENEHFSLREEFSELCKQTSTNANDLEPFQTLESLAVRGSPTTPLDQRQLPVLRDSFNGDTVKVNHNLQEAWSSSKPRLVSELRDQGEYDESQLSRDSPVIKDVVFIESSPCRSELFNSSAPPVGDEAGAKEEAKWYVNPMVETLEDLYNISTPERCNSKFSVCNPAVQGSFECEVLRSSSGSREMDPSTGLSPLVDSALTTPTQTTVSNSSYRTRSQTVVDDGALHKEYVAVRALCAAIILDLRRRMLSVLDKEVSVVMAALDTSVRYEKCQLASMHFAVASCWNASMPKALAALSLSPSEFDSWLLNEAQGASSWNDASKIEENIVSWGQYLEKSRQNEDRRIGELNGGLACRRVSSEDSAVQLLGESDKVTDKVKGCEDVAELVRQLQSKEVEVADLKKGQQALLEAKNKEIEELKEDFKRRDAELDKLLAAVETTKSGSADVQKPGVYQSPVMHRGRRYSTSSTPSSNSGNGTSQKRRFSDSHAPSASGSDPILEHIGRFKKEVPSNKGRLKNVPYINTQRHEELTDDGRSEHGDYSSTPGSTFGDDCSVNSSAFSETEVESRFGSEYCSSGDDSRHRSPKDRLLAGTYNRTLQKQKSASSDLRRAVTSSASRVRSLSRTQSNKNSASAISGSKIATGEKYSTKTWHRTFSGEIKKVIKDSNSPRTSNLKGLRYMDANYRRASSLDRNFKPNIGATLEMSGLSVRMLYSGSPISQDNSAIKRKRWV